jgi:hypothetical protein
MVDRADPILWVELLEIGYLLPPPMRAARQENGMVAGKLVFDIVSKCALQSQPQG